MFKTNEQGQTTNYIAAVVTGLAAFALSLLWYSPLLFGSWGLGRVSRPQQERDLWIGQNSLGRSLMAGLLVVPWGRAERVSAWSARQASRTNTNGGAWAVCLR
jgi:hypothetical protein